MRKERDVFGGEGTQCWERTQVRIMTQPPANMHCRQILNLQHADFGFVTIGDACQVMSWEIIE